MHERLARLETELSARAAEVDFWRSQDDLVAEGEQRAAALRSLDTDALEDHVARLRDALGAAELEVARRAAAGGVSSSPED